MMYMLGFFEFESQKVLPRSIQRTDSYQWKSQQRLGRGTAAQPIGIGKHTKKMDFKWFPCGDKSAWTLDLLREEAELMQPLWLIDGNGEIHGRFYIEKINEKRRELYPNSMPRVVEGSLDMTFYGEDYV